MIVEFIPETTINSGMAVAVLDAYAPAAHTHAVTLELPPGEVVPVGQETHVVASVAPVAVEYVPVEQSVHAALPVIVLNLPATHAAHGPPSGPVDPGLQPTDTHALILAPPIAEVVFAGQLAHPDVAVTQLFSCADAWAKSAFDRCVFQI